MKIRKSMYYEIIDYPDGGSYVKSTVDIVSEFTYKINSYKDLFMLKSIIEANGIPPSDLELIIPCMFQQQHDRQFGKHESFELKSVCEFINSIGFKFIHVFHPHSDVTPALLNNCIVIDNSEFILQVINQINSDNLLLMSTDAGGFKPLMKLVDTIKWEGDTYSATKSRKFENGKSKLIQVIDKTDFEGKDILIIDDLCVYGGTFIGLAKMLEERNAGKLFLAVSHTTVQNPNKDLEVYFEKVFTTNSKYDNYKLDNIDVWMNF